MSHQFRMRSTGEPSLSITKEFARGCMMLALQVFENLHTKPTTSISIDAFTANVSRLRQTEENSDTRFSPSPQLDVLFRHKELSSSYRLVLFLENDNELQIKLITFYIQELFLQAYLHRNPDSPIQSQELQEPHGEDYTSMFAITALRRLHKTAHSHFLETEVYEKFFLEPANRMKKITTPHLLL